jgi:hypothetical protein
MLALTMKETPRPAGTLTEKKVEQQIRRRAWELYEAGGRNRYHRECYTQRVSLGG